MENNVFLDIETIPSQSPDLLARFQSEVTPRGNIKKAESIEAWLVENAAAKAKEQLAKTSFDPAYGHICTIAWAIDNYDVKTAHMQSIADETEVLTAFFSDLSHYHRNTFIGHNVGAFDLRFIMCRAVVLGVKVPPCIPRDPKPWDKTVFDTMLAWAGSRGTISMDRLSEALSLPVKGDFSGADVADAWANGEHQKIAEYCAADVERTRAIWRKFDAAGLT